MTKELHLSEEQIVGITRDFPTPFHLYHEAGIRATAQALNQAFSWVKGDNGRGYTNYYAVKANPNPHILELLAEEGMGADTSSGPEVRLASVVGIEGPDIMFTGNHVRPAEYVRANSAGARINLDDVDEAYKLSGALNDRFPDTISFRYNPGDQKVDGVNDIIGKPEDSKFGVPEWSIERAYKKVLEWGIEHLGLHIMVASNELGAEHHVNTARLAFKKVAELSETLGVPFEFVNLGGGLGIPYKPSEQPVDYEQLAEGIQQAHEEFIVNRGLPPLEVVTENGRHVTGPHGWLITKVLDVKELFYHRDVGVDASTSSDLPRTANYDAYHEIMNLSNPEIDRPAVQRVVGSLCEDNDYFTGSKTKERLMPVMQWGDILAVADTGAHCRAMGSNYNGKLRCGELLLCMDGSVREIRRPETEADLFATLDYPGL